MGNAFDMTFNLGKKKIRESLPLALQKHTVQMEHVSPSLSYRSRSFAVLKSHIDMLLALFF
jgi:hypothetical protein